MSVLRRWNGTAWEDVSNNLTNPPTAGGAAYGTGSAVGFSPAGTAGQRLVSGGTEAPTWKTPVPFAMAAGAITATPSGTAIVFPVGLFTVAPIITFGPTYNQASGGAGSFVYISYTTGNSLTKDGVTITSGIAANVGCYWIAVQMTPTTAAGST